MNRDWQQDDFLGLLDKMTDPAPPATPHAKRRILAALPIPCGKRWGHWYRDIGLIVRTLREQGHDAHLVLLPSSEGPPESDEPVIIATREELDDPVWWKKHAPDAVILNFWGATRWESVRVAARQATPRLLEKLDTAGIYSPRMMWWRYFYVGYGHARDAGIPAPLGAARLLARTVAMTLMPGLLDTKRAASMGRMPVLAAETPLAVERTKRYLRMFYGSETNVTCIPHPVDEIGLAGAAGTPKENKIISVGRWDSHQKNFPMLIDTLGQFLSIHTDWSADVFGKLPAGARARLDALPAGVASRILLAGERPHAELVQHYGTARIFFMSSRHESFNIAAAEALCCGCSVVGWAVIASIPFFCGSKSGTPSYYYSAAHLLDALCVEAHAWKDGERDPQLIAAEWARTVGAAAVTRKTMAALGLGDE